MRNSLLFLLAACGTTDPTPAPQDGEVAPIGTPVGDPVTMTITPAGGTIASGDGVLSIAFPAGAVNAPTDITIQPVTNTSFSPAYELSYALSPNDLEFSQPVTLTFAGPADFVPDSDSPLVWLSAQDDAGYWHGKADSAVDPTTGAVSLAVTSFGVTAPQGASSARVAPGAPATHDTPWTPDFPYALTPNESTVKLKTGSVTLYESQCLGKDNEDQPLDHDAMLKTCKPVMASNGIMVKKWAIFGSSTSTADGTITPAADTFSALYKAPSRDPARPIRVEAHFDPIALGKPAYYISAIVNIECPWRPFGFGLGAAVCAPPRWNGSSHITQGDGSVIDSTWTFDLDPMSPNLDTYIVTTGTVSITKGPTPPQGCTLDIDASHAIGQHDGQMVVTETDSSDPMVPPTVTLRGSGTTVWLATYTTHCPNGDGTMQLSYQAEWWPPAFGGAPPEEPVTNDMASFDMDNGLASGHVTLTKVMPGA